MKARELEYPIVHEQSSAKPAPAARRAASSCHVNFAGVLRIVFTVAAILLQLAVLAAGVLYLRSTVLWLFLALEVLGVAEVLVLVDRERSSVFTIAWLIIILLLPVFGHVLFLLWGLAPVYGKKSRAMQASLNDSMRWLEPNADILPRHRQAHPGWAKLPTYLQNEGFPLYQNTSCRYYPLGELQFEEMLADLRQAQRFIFMEFFIVADGQVWDSVYEVLRQRAAAGVEIRLLYDDFGSIVTLPRGLAARLENDGIQARCFNPVHRHLLRMMANYRNHQKIVVVDGKLGYTGGTNLADEYANLYEKHGHWKDTAIRLEGEAVWSLTHTFLQMWNAESGTGEEYEKYHIRHSKADTGFVQPFTDGPLNGRNPAEAAYRQMAHFAQRSLYITTPYLIIDDAMTDAFCRAAQSGVDVRIVTPKKWDKWYVHMVTRSNYGRLLRGGVKIYEYTPGFIHAKTAVSDDTAAVTGSINLDYRSLHLHFENGVFLCGGEAVRHIRRDMQAVLAVSEEIRYALWARRPWHTKLLEFALRLFIPLL